MQTNIEIKKIVVKENIRKDYGDLTELTASIKENGVRAPIEINSKFELVEFAAFIVEQPKSSLILALSGTEIEEDYEDECCPYCGK